ncbi:hypothetical protein [Paracoccus sp. (in: a-proteobacteria)]|uniref:hypothetical protein n=1 Tax=Paracoccus sp. TaxID=267 RepID=UPI00396C50C8
MKSFIGTWGLHSRGGKRWIGSTAKDETNINIVRNAYCEKENISPAIQQSTALLNNKTLWRAGVGF